MDTTSIVTRTRALLVEHYVFPDVAARLDALLADRLAAGAYDTAATPEELGRLVTAGRSTATGRENVGGAPETVALVCGYLLDEPTHLNTMHDRDGPGRRFWSPGHVAGTPFGGTRPVYVPTAGRTFSGAEEPAYDLQQLGRVVVVGGRTGGGERPRRASPCTRTWRRRSRRAGR
ncbi:S41 family peptidase [Saccharothrix yanglingensis]|uniref:S41 family peptidase n=1 Tax=Saccharothrix yanglingensis TaxID=659496 RepID=UPI0027D2E22A|nr:S41 family peptidase [Saccharothrix yanglingensis]